MDIGCIINEYAEGYSPYVGKLVNHLPMSQWAIFKITNNPSKVQEYTDRYVKEFDLEHLEDLNTNEKIEDTIDTCLGNREKYEECLYLIKKMCEYKDIKVLSKEILNEYDLGLSSGLYHPLIRLAYALEGYKTYSEMEEEVQRSLAYYIISYRESIIFKKKYDDYSCEVIDNIYEDGKLINTIKQEKTLGKRIKALYSSKYYRDNGFIVEGTPREKIYKTLIFFSKLQTKTNSVILSHCITGMHALSLLEKYFDDFDRAVDIAITSMLSHIAAADIKYIPIDDDNYLVSWDYIMSRAEDTKDPHDLKLVYAIYELDKKYMVPELRPIVYRRLRYIY